MIQLHTETSRGVPDESVLSSEVLIELADEYKTPLYVYDGDQILKNFSAFQSAVSSLNSKVYFAVKANSSTAILSLLSEAGAGADIVSGGELQRAMNANISPDDIIFSGVGKTDDELLLAMHNKIGQINVESGAELDRITALASSYNLKCSVALRINVNVDPGSHEKISTGQNSTKFGIPLIDGQAEAYYQKVSSNPNLIPSGLAVHIGSQLTNLAPFQKAYSELVDFAEHLRSKRFEVPCLDLGGGLGIDYEEIAQPDFTGYGKMVERIFSNTEYKLGFEPGRAIVGNCGILITKVIYVKQGVDKRFIIVDAAMNDLIRPTLYEAFHRIDSLTGHRENKGTADIVGPICETGDYLARGRQMPMVEAGDYLAVRSVGAYGAVMMSNYNTRPEPSEILCYEGKVHIIRPRRTVEDLLKMENNPFL